MEPIEPETGNRKPSPLRVAGLALFWIYLAALVARMQFFSPELGDSDSHYNVRFANLLPSRGIDRTFPWMQHATQRDHFSDKEFLFHVFLIPFTTSEAGLATGGKIAGVVLALAIAAVLWRVLAAVGAPVPLLGTFMLFSASSLFLSRLVFIRSYLLSIILITLGFWLHASRRTRWLLVLGFVYAWSYTAPHALVLLSLAWVAAAALTEKKIEWKPLAASAGGVAAGLILHPYTPESLSTWWVQNVEVLRLAWGGAAPSTVFQGSELLPILPREYAYLLPGTCLLFVFGLLVAIRSKSLTTRFALIWAVLTFALFTRSMRFIEYFAPAAILLAACAAADLRAGAAEFFNSPMRRALGWILALGLAVYAHAVAVADVFTGLQAGRSRPLQAVKVGPLADAMKWARANLPKGESIAHVEWDDFGYLFYNDPDHYYVAGLDPTYAWLHDPATWDFLQSLKSADAVSGREIRDRLAMRYMVVKEPLLRETLRAAPDARELYRNDFVSIFELAP